MGLVVFMLIGLVAASMAGPARPGCENIFCTADWSPVCGEDGKTYSNNCAACGVRVACEGECPCKAKDLCDGKKCGEQCDSSLGLLQVVRYCQPDGSCGTNARPSCPGKSKFLRNRVKQQIYATLTG